MSLVSHNFAYRLWTFMNCGALPAAFELGLLMLDPVLAPDIKMELVGTSDSPIAGKTEGLDALKAKIVRRIYPYFATIIDRPSFEIVHTFGNEQSWWVALEFMSKGVSKAGKPYVNNGAAILHFNEEAKIDEGKVFMDLGYIHDHYEECKRVEVD